MCSQGKTVRVQEKQVKEEKGTEQGCDFRQSFSLSLIPWGSQECKLPWETSPFRAMGLGLQASVLVSHYLLLLSGDINF